MLVCSERTLAGVLAAAGGTPWVVCAGNFATPMTLLGLLDGADPSYRLKMLNAQVGISDRDGVVHETSFVGPGMRRSTRLIYVPARRRARVAAARAGRRRGGAHR